MKYNIFDSSCPDCPGGCPGTGPGTGGGTSVLERTETNSKLMPMYRVLLHNDDSNSMDTVVKALQDVFKFELKKCVDVMFEAHNSGVALCKIEPLETAELHQEQLQSFTLTATIEPEG